MTAISQIVWKKIGARSRMLKFKVRLSSLEDGFQEFAWSTHQEDASHALVYVVCERWSKNYQKSGNSKTCYFRVFEN